MGKLIGYQVMAGAGAGQTFQAGLIAIQASVPRSQMAVATAARKSVDPVRYIVLSAQD